MAGANTAVRLLNESPAKEIFAAVAARPPQQILGCDQRRLWM
jgi:hypothetical protein